MAEVWKPIPAYEDLYEISDFGRIRSFRTGKIRVQTPQSSGYLSLCLCKDGVARTFLVHSLVLSTFLGARPHGYDCCHNDGCKTNNLLSNLRWASRAENHADKILHGTVQRGENSSSNILSKSDVLRIIVDPRTCIEISKDFGVTQHAIQDIKSRRSWASVTEGLEIVKTNVSDNSGKLSHEEVREIYHDKRTQSEISSVFGISQTSISNIKNRRSYRHVLMRPHDLRRES